MLPSKDHRRAAGTPVALVDDANAAPATTLMTATRDRAREGLSSDRTSSPWLP
jgi:hypothetical protein